MKRERGRPNVGKAKRKQCSVYLEPAEAALICGKYGGKRKSLSAALREMHARLTSIEAQDK